MTQTIQAVRGMNDVLPDQAPPWEFFEETVRSWLAQYGYRNMRMPILEKTELFVRSIGEVTDIVEKEMYTFVDQLNGESLTLRPEGTASCVRAIIEHNLLYNGPQRVSYVGPMFRHERPQKGRYRQFHQVGVEALGFSGPDVDGEHMVMGASLWKRLGLDNLQLEINTLGNTASRSRFRTRLIAYLEKHFTADKTWPGPDVAISIDPPELADLVRGSRAVFEARGGSKTILSEEQPTIDFAYACVVTTRVVKAGETLSNDNIWVKRPGTGDIKARDFERVLGRR